MQSLFARRIDIQEFTLMKSKYQITIDKEIGFYHKHYIQINIFSTFAFQFSIATITYKQYNFKQLWEILKEFIPLVIN